MIPTLKRLCAVAAGAATLAACSDPAATVEALPLRTQVLPVSASPELGCSVAANLPPGGITAVDTSLTPRANQAAEILAMEASGELVAPQALYERVKDELRVIFGRGEVPVMGCSVPGQLLLGVTDAGFAQIESGAYTAWDAYNSTLKLTERLIRSSYPGYGSYKLVFDGVYNQAALEQAYGQLPEMRYADGNGYVGGSYDTCLERFGDENDTHVYIAWYGSGDCPAGCTYKVYYGYSAEASGAIEYLGAYGGGPEPDWFSKASQCRKLL